MTSASDLLRAARNELGYREEGPNITKYNREYYGENTPAEWCVIFVWYLFDYLGYNDLFYDGGKITSCTNYWKWAKTKGTVVDEPKPGDIVLLNWDGLGSKAKVAHHMGIYVGLKGNNIQTIEGNTSTDSDTTDRVMLRTRSRKNVCAYIRVGYDVRNDLVYRWQVAHIADGGTLPKFGTDGEWGHECIKGANKHLLWYRGKDYRYIEQTKLAQELLGLRGDQVDGKYGPTTMWHVQRYQRHNGLVVDGKIGPLTWAKLLEV